MTPPLLRAGENLQRLEAERPPRPGRLRLPAPVRRRPQGALEDGGGHRHRPPQRKPPEAEGRV